MALDHLKAIAASLPDVCVANATMAKLPSLHVTNVSVSGFSSGSYMTSNLCNQDPRLFSGCGSFCGGLIPISANESLRNSTRATWMKAGNAPDYAFKAIKWYMMIQK